MARRKLSVKELCHEDSSRGRVCAGAMGLAPVLLQKCHPRHWQPNDRAGSANLGEKQITIPMWIWSKGSVGIHACTLRRKEPRIVKRNAAGW